MTIDDIRHVFVIGAGTMGRQIALRCAVEGLHVTLYDIAPAALRETPARLRADAAAHVAVEPRLAGAALEAALDRLRLSSDPAEAATADLLSESIFEDPVLKGEVFGRFHAICPPHTIFTTDTSTLVPSQFAAATGRPARFAAFHFHNVWFAPLVDVMPHPGTAPEIGELLVGFARRIGQVPILIRKESPGYLYNAMFGALNRVALHLFFDGVAPVEDIDRAWMIVTGMPRGPFGILDGVGLDTVWRITATAAAASGDPVQQAWVERFKRDYVDTGRLGEKSGHGFYSYPDPAFARPGFLAGGTAEAGGAAP